MMEFMIGTKLLSVRNFYWYETFIGTKLLSVRNFYQYETFIDGTFIGTKLLDFFLSVHMAFKLLSVQWLMNE